MSDSFINIDQINPADPAEVRQAVRQRYGQIASSGTGCCGPSSSCCSPAVLSAAEGDLNSSSLYPSDALSELPDEITAMSLGCGDPITLAALQPGQVVLDLGSGAGLDCFLAARRVGPNGRVIGVDMTPAMLEKARQNQQRLGIENVEFRLGEIEHLPVADHSVDVIISNCVINLSPDKPQVLREAFRVLRPGGRLAVSDILSQEPLPDALRSQLNAWASCIGGALDIATFSRLLEEAGFREVDIQPTPLPAEMVAPANAALQTANVSAPAPTLYSARITARKPEK